jgi:Cdc6-like AAA superfamily ATPase
MAPSSTPRHVECRTYYEPNEEFLEDRVNRELVMNAFLPAAGVEDPHRFAGRGSEIEELTNALSTKGSIPLVYGQRGLGKSSLALQMSRIAQGDVELLSELELEDLALPEEQRYITFYVNCTDSTKNLRGLLQMMINAVESLKNQKIRDDAQGEYRLIDKSTRRGVSLKFFHLETTKSYVAQVQALDTAKFSPEELLLRLTETLTDVYGQKVLFVVDELDRVSNTKGLASFLKSYSSEYLKFMLVGIGTTEGALLRDHASLSRQLVPVGVSTMSKLELESIVDRTEEYLAEGGESLTFAPSAKTKLAQIAQGFPWFVHVLGQAALVAAVRDKRLSVERIHIDEIVKTLASGRLARQFNDLYHKAVRDSFPREYVLRLFAHWPAEDIPTSEIYPKAKALGVTAPSNYLGHLTQEQCGHVLAPSPQQSRLYRFTDGMFKVYVQLRPSIYENLDSEVRAAVTARRTP